MQSTNSTDQQTNQHSRAEISISERRISPHIPTSEHLLRNTTLLNHWKPYTRAPHPFQSPIGFQCTTLHNNIKVWIDPIANIEENESRASQKKCLSRLSLPDSSVKSQANTGKSQRFCCGCSFFHLYARRYWINRDVRKVPCHSNGNQSLADEFHRLPFVFANQPNSTQVKRHQTGGTQISLLWTKEGLLGTLFCRIQSRSPSLSYSASASSSLSTTPVSSTWSTKVGICFASTPFSSPIVFVIESIEVACLEDAEVMIIIMSVFSV